MMPTLRAIFDEHQGKVSDKWEHYLERYEKIFADRRNSQIRLIEIGVQNGGSLEIWSKYFAEATSITGIDIDPKVGQIEFDDQRITALVADATKPDLLEAFDQDLFPVDVIIDDGSHLSGDVIRSFLLLFPHLREGGIYVVEDAQTSYYADFDGALFDPASMMAFFTRLTDVINREHWDGGISPEDAIASILSLRGIDARDFEWIETIHAITFSNSMITIEKASPSKNTLGRQLVRGSKELVREGRLKLNGLQYERPRFAGTDENKRYRSTTPEQTLVQLTSKLHEQGEELEERNQSVEHLKQVIAAKDAEMSIFLGSTSWRVTRPMRWLMRQARRGQSAIRKTPAAISIVMERGGIYTSSRVALRALRRDGPAVFLNRLRGELAQAGAQRLRIARPEDYDLDMSRVEGGPTISVLIPIYNTPIDYLNICINSVRNQIYQNWQLILIDDNSSNEEVRDVIREHAETDERIKCVFREENGHISKALNSGLKVCEGDYAAVLDHDDVLDASALYWVALKIKENPDADYVYTDEDKLSEDGSSRFSPMYKPDWSPEYMLSSMYTCHFSVFRTSILHDIGGYRSDFDGTQDYDLALRCVARTGNIYHVPRVLYHWRIWSNSTAMSIEAKPYALERQQKALIEYLDSKNERYTIKFGPLPGHHSVTFLPQSTPLISLVIATANSVNQSDNSGGRFIDSLVASILEKTDYKNYEIVISHNGNLTNQQLETFGADARIRLVEFVQDGKFSLARKLNLAAASAKGEFLVLMNDDLVVISTDWLDQMLGMAQRDGVGVVGPKLLFPNDTIQHAGVVILNGLPHHAYYGERRHVHGYCIGARFNRNYIAVTGACSMVRKSLFDQIGGYNLKYPINYNDIDFCLRLHQLGYRTVYLANAELYHFEGVSRAGGVHVAPEEMAQFRSDWGSVYPEDPYYNPNLPKDMPYKGLVEG